MSASRCVRIFLVKDVRTLAELKEKMAAKRAAKAKEDAKADFANEAIRRKAGRVRVHVSVCLAESQTEYAMPFQDINAVREEMKQKELIKEAEKKRRGKPCHSLNLCAS